MVDIYVLCLYVYMHVRGVGRGTHQQTDTRVHRSPRLVMFYGSGYILRFFFFLMPFLRALYNHNSGYVITFKRVFTHVPPQLAAHAHKLGRYTCTHVHHAPRTHCAGFPGVGFFFNFNVRASHLTTKHRRRSPPRGIKDPWARLLLVTTSLPACPLFLRPENSCSFVCFQYYVFISNFFLFFFFFYQYYRHSNRNIFNHLENPSHMSPDNNIIILSKLVFLECLSIFLK